MCHRTTICRRISSRSPLADRSTCRSHSASSRHATPPRVSSAAHMAGVSVITITNERTQPKIFLRLFSFRLYTLLLFWSSISAPLPPCGGVSFVETSVLYQSINRQLLCLYCYININRLHVFFVLLRRISLLCGQTILFCNRIRTFPSSAALLTPHLHGHKMDIAMRSHNGWQCDSCSNKKGSNP